MKNIIKILVLSMCVMFVNNIYAQQFLGGGSGTAEDPYKIYTAAQWDEFAEEYNLNDNDRYGEFSGIHIELMNDLTGEERITKHLLARNNPYAKFKGCFHGKGHKIDISDVVFSFVNGNNEIEILTDGCLFRSVGYNAYIDSLEIVGTTKNFTSIVGSNYGKLNNLICNVVCEPTSEIYHTFFLQYAVIMTRQVL